MYKLDNMIYNFRKKLDDIWDSIPLKLKTCIFVFLLGLVTTIIFVPLMNYENLLSLIFGFMSTLILIFGFASLMAYWAIWLDR